MEICESTQPVNSRDFLFKVTEDINTRNGKVFDFSQLEKIQEYLLDYAVKYNSPYQFLGHGGSAITFSDPACPNKQVIKIAKKSCLSFFDGDPYKWKLKTDPLFDYLLPVLEIIFIDDNYFIYKQERCVPINNANQFFHAKWLIRILTIWVALWKSGLFLCDMASTNFGVIGNKTFLFDYNDVGSKISEEFSNTIQQRRNVTIYLMNYLSMIKYSIRYKGFSIIPTQWLDTDPERENYGKDLFGPTVSGYLKAVDSGNDTEACKGLEDFLQYIIIESNIKEQITSYQIGSIDPVGNLEVIGSTLEKYKLAKEAVKVGSLGTRFGFLDAGCCIGLIGLKMVQDFPCSHGKMCNLDPKEIEEANRFIHKLGVGIEMLPSIDGTLQVFNQNLLNIEESFDLTLYFALVHHLLRAFTFEAVMKTISKQTKKVAVVEFTLGEDVLMHKVRDIGLNGLASNGVDEFKDRYEHMKDIITVKKSIQKFTPEFSVAKISKVEYGTTQLVRWAFILVKK